MANEPEEDPTRIQVDTGWDKEYEDRFYINCWFPKPEHSPDSEMAGFEINLTFSPEFSQRLRKLRDELDKRGEDEDKTFASIAQYGGDILIAAAMLTAAFTYYSTSGNTPLAFMMQAITVKGLEGLLNQLKEHEGAFFETIESLRDLVRQTEAFDRFITGGEAK